MGDIADYLIENMLDHALEFDYFDEYAGTARRALQCRHCGTTAVRWERTNGAWRLYNSYDKEPHVCPMDDEFIDLTKETT